MSTQSVVAEEGYAFPLSFQQQRLWLIDKLYPQHPAYNLPLAIPIEAPVDHEALLLATNEMIRRHESLRTTIRTIDGEPRQVVGPFAARRFPLTDLSKSLPRDRDDEVRRLVADNAVRGFDLAAGPLLRLNLLRLGPQRHLLLIAMHHIISDGWSLGVFWQELVQLYAAAASGRPPDLPEPALQYADFAEWQREWLQSDILDRQLEYWRGQLRDAPTLDFPTDRPRPKAQSYVGDARQIRIATRAADQLRALAGEQGATPFMVLSAAFAAVLRHYTGQTDIVVGTPITNRNRLELEKVIGFFVNSLVLRFDLRGDPTFTELLTRIRQTLVDAYARQDTPFERLVEALNIERDPSRNPLFQVTIQMFNGPGASGGDASRSGPSLLDLGQGSAMFDLAASFWESGRQIAGSIRFSADLFDGGTIDRLCAHFANLLAAAVAQPELRLSQLPLMSAQERDQMLTLARPLRHAAVMPSVQDEVAAAAAAWPNREAIISSSGSLTYGELLRGADALASRLQRLGVRRGDLVGVHMPRSPELVLAILATLRAGAAWLPLDPQLPPDRLAEMVRDASPSVIVTHGRAPWKTGFSSVPVLDLDRMELPECAFAPVSTSPADLAYVLYTSGSTGTPKGVAVPHRALTNLVGWMRGQFPLGADDTVLYKTPFSFDASIWELFLPLTTGARLALAAPNAHRDPRDLIGEVVAHRATVLQLVPSMLRLFLDDIAVGRCDSLRRLFAGGEALPGDLLPAVRDTLGAELCNLYGPTETCVQSSFHVCLDEQSSVHATMPIGRAIDGTTLYVVDGRFELQPIGIPGELYIGGVGLARGYLGKPALTAERFVPDPFGAEPGGRIYRTGDRVRWRADGTLEFLGRIDAQLKLRGFRIEPAEIEAVLATHPDVQRSSVTVHADDKSGPQLIAYINAAPGCAPLQSELRRYLADRLPYYMVPSMIVALDDFPLLPSGKIDRGRLPAPEQSPEQWTPLNGVIEEAVADIWAEVLGIERIGANDDFFAHLGGHSLLATRVAARLSTLFQVEMPLRWLFEHSTVRGFAEVLCTDPNISEHMQKVADALVDVAVRPGAALSVHDGDRARVGV